jgi:integrase/recombinase XerD
MGYTNERKEFVGMTPLRKQMIEELQLRNLSEATIHTYVHAVERYAKHFNTSPAKLGPEQVREYLLYLLNNHHVSSSTIQVNRGALKFLYVKTLKQRWFDDEIPYPKKQVRLPDVIRADDIARILDRTSNLKHWTIIATLYATGLRVHECSLLQIADIDHKDMIIRVRHGKGRVPRNIPLSEALQKRLAIYCRRYRPTTWLFPSSMRAGRPLDDHTIRHACRNAGKRAGIQQPVHPHLFRHACATHMLEAGADLRTIQHLLGHADIRTTARYLHVSMRLIQAIRSPFDALILQPIDLSQEGEDD